MNDDDMIKRLANLQVVKKVTADLKRRGIKYQIIPIQQLENGRIADFEISFDIKKEEK